MTRAEERQQRKAKRLKLRTELTALTDQALAVHSVRCLASAFGTKERIIHGWSNGHVGTSLATDRLVTLVWDMRGFAEMEHCFFPSSSELVRVPSGYWTEERITSDNVLETKHHLERKRCKCGAFIGNRAKRCKLCHNRLWGRVRMQVDAFVIASKAGRFEDIAWP